MTPICVSNYAHCLVVSHWYDKKSSIVYVYMVCYYWYIWLYVFFIQTVRSPASSSCVSSSRSYDDINYSPELHSLPGYYDGCDDMRVSIQSVLLWNSKIVTSNVLDANVQYKTTIIWGKNLIYGIVVLYWYDKKPNMSEVYMWFLSLIYFIACLFYPASKGVLRLVRS